MFKVDLTIQSLKLADLDAASRKEVLGEIDRILDRALRDQSRDRIINELQRARAEHATIARDVAGIVPEYLTRKQAWTMLDVKRTVFTQYKGAGLISPVDSTAKYHRFFRHEIQALKDIPEVERRRRVREWQAKQNAA